jgi:hypothetical protein
MRGVIKLLLSILVALILGIGTAFIGIRVITRGSAVKNGAWLTNLAVGSKEAGMYTRAAVALTGLFALNKEETIYYRADSDDSGQPLHSGCNYRIEGWDIDTRWWSITVYGGDNFLIPSDINRYAYNGMNVMRKADGSYIIRLSSTPKDGNWLPTGKQGNFSLSLRLYNPAPVVYENPGTIRLPHIIREECK